MQKPEEGRDRGGIGRWGRTQRGDPEIGGHIHSDRPGGYRSGKGMWNSGMKGISGGRRH